MPKKGRGQSIAAGGAENEGSKQTKGGQKKTRAAGTARDQNAIGSGGTAVGSSERASKLAQILAARLSYACYKVNRGCISQNINELEHLQASRFSEQAERRKALKGKGKATALDDSKATYKHVEHASNGPFAMLADPQGHAVLTGSSMEPPPSPRNHYYGYTAPNYLNTHSSAYSYQPVDSHTYFEQVRQTGVTPPPHEQVLHPSPSMYNYLASPLVPSGPWSSNYRPDSAMSTSRPVASEVPGHADGNWRSGAELSTYSDQHHHVSNGLVMADPHDLGTPGVTSQSTAPPFYTAPPAQGAQHSLMPAPSIPAVRQYGQSASLQRGHAKNRSLHALRGEYSASNVTMDDLDSHFQ